VVVRDRPAGAAAPVAPAAAAPSVGPAPEQAKGTLGQVLRNPQAWLIALAMAMFNAAQMSLANFLPTMLSDGKEMNLATAGTYASFFAWGGLAGSIVLPMLAAKLHMMKPLVMIGGFLSAVFAIGGWLVAPSIGFVVCIFMSGLTMAAISNFVTAAPPMLKSIGPARAGTAGGLVATVGGIVGYVYPTFFVSVVAGVNYTLMAILGAGAGALVVVFLLFVPDWGRTAKAAAPAEAKKA
jgi:NNP family nitrate/nitrite transporter-like MFS transporter